MKRTLLKTVGREIRDNLGRFFAIFAITALGVGFLAGLLSTAPDLYRTMDDYYDRLNFMDVNIKSTGGLTSDDLAALREKDYVEQAVPVRAADVLADRDGDELAVRLYGVDTASLSDTVNQTELVEGRYPQASNECAAVVSSGTFVSASVGEVLHLKPEDASLLAETELTVVGLVKSPLYYSIERETTSIGNGRISLVLVTDMGLYGMDYYTDFFVTLRGAQELNGFKASYEELRDDAKDRLSSLAAVREELRYEEILETAYAELETPTAVLEEQRKNAEAELRAAEEKLTSARAQLNEAQTELEKNADELADAKLQLQLSAPNAELARGIISALDVFYGQYGADGSGNPDAALRQLDEQLAALEADYKAARDGLEAELDRLPDNEGLKATLTAVSDDIEQTLTALRRILARVSDSADRADAVAAAGGLLSAQLRTGVSQYDAGLAAYQEGERQLNEARAEIAQSEQEYSAGLAAYEEQKAQAEAALSDAEQQLEDGRSAVSQLQKPKWYILDRESNVSYVSLNSNISKVDSIAKVFPVFFFLVAALVALTTMTRMIDEQRTEIGALKALGYSNGAIAGKYLLYSGTASVTGGLAGLLIGLQLLPRVIINAYSIMYRLPALKVGLNPILSIPAWAAAVLCIAAATLFAVWGNLRETSARLMLPKAPKTGQRILLERFTVLWNRMRFTHKVTARNLFRYKKRLFMTVIGISGCTALLLTGFGLRDAIGDIVSKQYSELQQYNLSVGLIAGNDHTAVYRYLDGHADGYFPIYTENGAVADEDGEYELNLYVVEDPAEFSDYMTLRERRGGKKISFHSDSVIVTEKFAASHGIAVGSAIVLKNGDGRTAEVTVTGICENYIYSYIYLSAEQYAQLYGEAGDAATLLVKMPSADEDAVMTDLLSLSGVASATFSSAVITSFDNMLDKINYIVYVLIVSAGLLAFVVLYNLTNINISERSKEIATLKVLGFFDHEVSAYIYRENYALSLIGTLLGLVFGIFLCRFVVTTAEVDIVMFGRSIYPLSYLLAAVITLFFTFLVTLVMFRRLKRIDMVESMKSVD